MPIEIEIVEEVTQSEDYDRFLAVCRYGFIQQSSIWRDVIKGLGPDEPYLLLARDGGNPVGAMSLYCYRGRFGNIMTSVPQPGPLGGIACQDDYPQKEVLYRELINYAVALGREKECSLLTIITNPFVNDSSYYRDFLAPEYELENFTQYIILEEIFDREGTAEYLKRRNIVKRKLKAASSAGIEVRESTSSAELDIWYEIHSKRHKEVRAKPLEKRLFQNILNKVVPAANAKFLVAHYNNMLIGGCFYIYNRYICDAFLMSSDSDFIELGTNFALTDNFLRWSSESGRQVFNWQSSPSRLSGVYDFKKRWGSKEAGYYFFTKVLGDISRILNGNFEEVKDAYKNHFLLPCEGVGGTGGKTFGEFVKNKVRKN
ncbi:MAG: GNAT family N-acetyltransferase [Thermodesulfovibrionales bacterium]